MNNHSKNANHLNGNNLASKPITQDATDNHQLSRTIKVLVEIVNSTFDFSISKNIKISDKINEILDINWSLSPVDYQINLLANMLWISGKLNAEITYTKTNNSKIHLQNLFIPWKNTFKLEYIYPPILPLSNEKTHYDFWPSNDEPFGSTHYEQVIHQNDKAILEITSSKIITTKHTKTIKNSSYLILDIHCEMFYRIWQNQLQKQ